MANLTCSDPTLVKNQCSETDVLRNTTTETASLTPQILNDSMISNNLIALWLHSHKMQCLLDSHLVHPLAAFWMLLNKQQSLPVN